MTTKVGCLFLLGAFPVQAMDGLQNTIGIYHWGSQYPATVSEGVRQIAMMGGRVSRIVLSAKAYQDYQMAQGCYPNFSLASFVQEPDIKAALDNPGIDVYILTAYDGASFGDCIHQNFLAPLFYTPDERSKIVEEYAQLTLYLYQTYGTTHKRFILSNWESDNSVYCGQANRYALDDQFRAYCNAAYPQLYGGNRTPDDSLAALKVWFDLREQGVQSGRERAAAAGVGGMRVYLAPEFCSVRALHDRGFKSVLYDVIPFVIFDYVSYSSYESINAADPSASLTADLNTIRDVIGSTAIIIGEAGFARSQWGDSVTSRTSEVVSAALSWGVQYFVHWELYDQSGSNDFGLLDANGNSTPLATYFRNCFQSSNSSRATSFAYANDRK